MRVYVCVHTYTHVCLCACVNSECTEVGPLPGSPKHPRMVPQKIYLTLVSCDSCVTSCSLSGSHCSDDPSNLHVLLPVFPLMSAWLVKPAPQCLENSD